MIDELWKEISGLNGLYEISNNGRLRSYWKPGGKSRSNFPKVLAITVNGRGYPAKFISGKNYRVHRLVAEAFLENPRQLPMINHIDGNKMNNHVSNLEWCDKSHNERHAQRMGLKNKARGEKCKKSHLTSDVVREIMASDLGCRQLATIYGVNYTTISSIRTGKTWNHITGLPLVVNKRNVSIV